LLPAFDAYALPSRSEALGISIIEASAAAIPIVAASVGGVPEVVLDGETGILVPPQEPAALAEALTRMYSDDALANRLGQNARQRYLSCFTVDQMVQSTLNVYRKSLGQSFV
jgi:glycosyltransferase involved in cell wall biosynthesis